MENIKNLLGKRIKELRKEKNFSQEKLAESIGIDPNNLSRIENGKNYPAPETIAKIANTLNVEVYKLFFFNHHTAYETVREEIINSLNDENFGRMLYKFYLLLKE